MSFAIARQAIFDKEGKAFGYEIYLRRTDDLEKYPKDIPFNKATFIVSELLVEIGVEKVGEGKRVFINVALDSVLNKTLEILKGDKLTLQLIPPQVSIGKVTYPNILKAIDRFKEKGALISVTDSIVNNGYEEVVEKADILEVSIKKYSHDMIKDFKSKGKLIMFTFIEKEKEFKQALELGDLFEGRYLGDINIVKKFEIAPFLKSTLMRLLAVMNVADSVKEFAHIISSDVGMTTKLLKFINSAYFSPATEIKSIDQACSFLGMDNLKKFILLVATNDYVSIENPILWKKSLRRAIIAEFIALRTAPDLKNEAYLAGLFSLIDEILHVDKIAFLKELRINQEIIDAFTGKNERLAKILKYASALEDIIGFQVTGPQVTQTPGGEHDILFTISNETGIPVDELQNAIQDAVSKADILIKI